MDWDETLSNFWTGVMREALDEVEKNVEQAKEEYIRVWKQALDSGRVGDEGLSPYKRTQKWRRDKAGLQTSKKDFKFHSSLRESVQETERERTRDSVRVTITFTGDSIRRRDQKPATNQQVATYLSLQQTKGKPILVVSEEDKSRIENTYNVTIT